MSNFSTFEEAFYEQGKFGFLKDVIKLKFSAASIKRILWERCGWDLGWEEGGR